MGDRKDGDARLPRRCSIERAHVQRLALEPTPEPRRREKTVDPHSELASILFRVELLEVERANSCHRRLLDPSNECLEVQILTLGPCRGEERRDENVLATLDRIRGDADEREQACRRRAHPLAKELGVLAEL